MPRKHDLVRIVYEDLQYLREKWDSNVDEASLRISSSILRRLLVNSDLQLAWKGAGFEREPIIRACTLQPAIETFSAERLASAWAGGGLSKGLEIRAGLDIIGFTSDEEDTRFYGAGPPDADFGLRAYVEAPCMVLHGHLVPRRVLTKFIVNTLGGNHLGGKNKRRHKQNEEEKRLYPLLDEARNTLIVTGQRVVYYELLSAGQALVASDDVRHLQERIRETLHGSLT